MAPSRLTGGAAALCLFAVLASGSMAAPAGAVLPDARGWEMVSPIEKNGGQVDPPGAIDAGGVLQAAEDGASVTYGSIASFGGNAGGAPPASQYISRRGAGAWSTENISTPLYSGSYGDSGGVPYRLFSGDLARGLLLNGRHCRGEVSGCAVANQPITGTDAPAGYQNYYLRDSATGGFQALLGAGDLTTTPLLPAQFDLRLAGTSPDLRHVVLSTCAALTANATEVPGSGGCDLGKPNLYEWSPGAGLSLVNLLPGQTKGTPGAAIAAPSGAVSADGARVYWTDLVSGNLYLREGGQTEQVDAGAGGGGVFQTATPDGSIALYTKAGHLYRYDVATQASTDLTPSGGVVGVLGASDDTTYVYYLTASGLFLRHEATTTLIASTADAGNYPPATGTARVSASGTSLAFVSTAPLTGYDNTDLKTGELDSEVYLYRADAADPLVCASCNPAGRPIGPATISGAIANGQGADSTEVYKPRVLSLGGKRLFFDSLDALAVLDTNADWDVYQWEAEGTGSCTRAGGCVDLISSGKAPGGARFVDASTDGSDAFFLTDGSLVGSDPGSVDLYDARVGGGFPEPPIPIPCEGDACQSLPSEPRDPTLTTLLAGPGNPAVRYRRQKHRHRTKGRHRHRNKAHGHVTRAGGR
jgi:hypothetical protein